MSKACPSIVDSWTGKVKVQEIYTGYKKGCILFNTSGYHIKTGNFSVTNLYSIEPSNADF